MPACPSERYRATNLWRDNLAQQESELLWPCLDDQDDEHLEGLYTYRHNLTDFVLLRECQRMQQATFMC